MEERLRVTGAADHAGLRGSGLQTVRLGLTAGVGSWKLWKQRKDQGGEKPPQNTAKAAPDWRPPT